MASSSAPTTKSIPKRLTLSEKADIIHQLSNGATVRDTASRFACNLRTIQKIRKKSIQLLAALHESTPNAQFKALKFPKFPEIDAALYEFVQIVRGAKLPLSGSVLRCRALQIRDIVLEQDHNHEDINRLQSFSASPNWVTCFTRRHDLRSVRLHGEGGSVSVRDVSARICRLREQLADFDEAFIFNMDETGLFFKLFPKKTYILSCEDKHKLRGTKDMKAKARVSLYVCTNATGTLKVPMSIIGGPKVPDASGKLALVMDNCGPHGADLLDAREHVSIFTLPPNCTFVFQSMDMGVIAALKLKYNSRLLERISATVEHRNCLREGAKKLKAGMKGLDEGHDPYMLDVCDLIFELWEEIFERTVVRCWIKADILPRGANSKLIGIHGKVKREEAFFENGDISAIAKMFSNIHLHIAGDVVSDADYIDDVDLRRGVTIEDDEIVREALVNETFDAVENCLRGRGTQSNAEFRKTLPMKRQLLHRDYHRLLMLRSCLRGWRLERKGQVSFRPARGFVGQSEPFSRLIESRRGREHGRHSFPSILSSTRHVPAMRSEQFVLLTSIVRICGSWHGGEL